MERVPSTPGGALRLLAAGLVWFALTARLPELARGLLAHAPPLRLSFVAFSTACQLLAALAGLLLVRAVVGPPRRVLAVAAPRRAALLHALLVAPAVFAASAYVAGQIALPLLLAEHGARGPGVSRRAAGAFGQALAEGPLLMTLLWAALFAAVAEELLFRGALFGALARLLAWRPGRVAGAAADATADRLAPWLATVATAALFGWAHTDLAGGLGVFRAVAATALGLACGACRHLSGGVLAPMLLHLAHNLLAVGHARRLFESASFPVVDGTPTLVAAAGGVGLLVSAALLLRARAAERASSLRDA